MIEFERAFDVMHQIDTYGVRYDSIVLATGSQMGKTDAVLDIIGWTMEQRPAPLMYVGPNKEFLHKEIEPRLMTMLTGTPSLSRKLATGKRTSKWRKTVGGVPIALQWAGSAASLAGMAAKIVLVDELDRMVSSVQGEGDPYTILEGRGFSFRDRMRGGISTPTIGFVDIYRCPDSGLEFWRAMESEDVQSAIWRHWQSGTMHHFSWPCPQCGEYFVPRFKQLRWPEGALPAEAKREAHLECPTCGGVIEEHHKPDMNARGVYVAPGETVGRDGVKAGKPRDTTTLSLWASGLCAAGVTFGERAASYVAAKISGEQEKIQAAINVGFGECYMPGGGDVPEWQEVAKLKAPYKSGSLPEGVQVLVLTCDVQKMRLIYVIRGWGAYATSWLIEAGEIAGPTTSTEVWDKLATVLTTPIDGMPIKRAFIDSGYRPGKPYNLPVNRVYQFCRQFSRRAYATKGRATMDKPVAFSRQEIKPRGEAHKYGLDLVLIDTDYTKAWVHERIRWPSEKPGAWHLPEDTTDDYCKQIVSEARVRKPNGQPEWVQRSRENHFLDCFDEKTELLTSDGWVPVADTYGGMRFATVNLETDGIEYQSPTALISRHHVGDMVQISGRSIDALVTPNHRMVTTHPRYGLDITLAKDLTIWHRIKRSATWSGVERESFTLKSLGKEPEREISADDWMEFLGWYVSEGHRRKGSARNWQVILSQSPGEKNEQIRRLLDRLPWRYRVTDNRQFVMTSRQLFEAVDCCYFEGKQRCYNKQVPAAVKGLSPRLIEAFLNTAVDGDGWRQHGSRNYATTSRKLADDVQELFLKIGRSANLKIVNRPPCTIRGKSYHTVTQYHVSEIRTPAALLRRSDNAPIFRNREFDGMVYCVSVPNGTLIARRNGKAMIVGNCEAMQAGMAHWLRFDLRRDPIESEDDPSAPEPVAKKKPRRRSKEPDATPAPAAKKPARRSERRSQIAELSKRLYG